MSGKIGVLFLNLGGPDSLDAVQPFLYNLFSDPDIFDIFQMPSMRFIQKPFAWLVSTVRLKMAQESYRLIGGRSPIVPLTQAQADAMQAHLKGEGIEVNVYLGMRYWRPFIEDAVDQILNDGIEQLIVLPLYPQYSLTTTGSSMQELARVLAMRDHSLEIIDIRDYYQHPEYLASLAATVQEGLAERPWTCPQDEVLILFSAHSLPTRFVEKTGDVYPQQIQDTARLLMETHFPNNPWQICYQSRIGNIPWLSPYTEEAIKDLAATRTHNILMLPVSFVSDHIETLYEIDLLYLPLARELNIAHCYRTNSLNTHPQFIKTLATLVKSRIHLPIGVV